MEHLGWGLQMTVLGMGLVFALLALLWVLLTLVLKLDKEEEEGVSESSLDASDEAVALPARVGEMATDLVAAIMVATMKHKAHCSLPADLAAAITVAAVKHKKALQSEAATAVRAFWPGTQPSRWTTAGRERARQTNNWNPRGR